MKKRITSLFILLFSTQLMAAEKAKSKPVLDKQQFSIGAGITDNSVGPFDDTGFQFFAGYDLSRVNLMEGVNTGLEFGYIDYGFDSGDGDGIWATAVVDGSIKGQLGWLARAGIDFGDDSGLMIGAGISLGLNNKTALRLEYVIRDDVDSLQLNLRYHM